MNAYVVGLMFSPDMKNVVLIKKDTKDKPGMEWQHGLLNGIGGKIEYGETSAQANVREFKEETGVETTEDSWRYFGKIESPKTSVTFYGCVGDTLKVRTMEKEEVVIYHLDSVRIKAKDMVENLPWLIALAYDFLTDGRPRNFIVQYPE